MGGHSEAELYVADAAGTVLQDQNMVQDGVSLAVGRRKDMHIRRQMAYTGVYRYWVGDTSRRFG